MKNRLFFPGALFALALTLQTTLALCQKLTVQAESGKQTVLARADIEALPHVKVRPLPLVYLLRLRASRLGLCWKKRELGSTRL